jgi:DNA-binding response OmpR family regulator
MTSSPSKALGPILVVDDDDDIREIIELALMSYGYRVLTASSGKECLRQMRQPEKPSLVILDLMMPDVNGWAVCEEVARDESLSAIPIVILTGNSEIREESLGRAPVMKKPLELARLLAVVEAHAR